MTLLLVALLVALTAATGIVLADSGLRMWSAVGALKAQQIAMRSDSGLPALRGERSARVTTRVSYARVTGAAPRRAAA